ncbi:LysE/ArgO family amino acid transporter [Microbacterium sp. NC79]|nr:LysE/ArgO family amino acid transporter [Microbacterium sp. NC79]
MLTKVSLLDVLLRLSQTEPMSFLVGLGIGLSLIIAIGAQNAFVLRQGVRREHVFAVALVCATSDAILILLGVAGVGVALQAAPWLIVIARWAGVAFLVTYATLALRRALKPGDTGLVAAPDSAANQGAPPHGSGPRTAQKTLMSTVVATLAITWLNPHVYLDTIVFLGSVAQTQDDGRWLFAFGAFTGSFVWFFALAYGARYLGRFLNSARSWQVLDIVIAIFMLIIAGVLAFGG